MNTSPFKFLSAYEKSDHSFFFGREKESKDLYELTYDTRLILLYGASGTGKTSLVKCGLANKFRDSRWLGLYIRRNINLVASIKELLIEQLSTPLIREKAAKLSLIEIIEIVYLETFKPIYLLLDQFEELFILQPTIEEQIEFFEAMKAVVELDISCSIIIIMREEFIAHLWEYEKMIPYLFDHRYRVEEIRSSDRQNIINQTLTAFEKKGYIHLEQKETVSLEIAKKLNNNKTGSELTYLQVFLHRLYQLGQTKSNQIPIFNSELVNKLGDFDDVLGDFLMEQLRLLDMKLGEGKEGISLQLLGTLVTDAKTKKVVNIEYLDKVCKELNLSQQELQMCIQTFENMRIIRRYD